EESDAFSVPLPQAEALSPENEFCGVAAETMAYEAPTKNLCRIGSASAVSGNGPWTWSCVNNEGKTSSCKTLSLGGASDTQPATASSSGFLQLPAKSAKPAAETLACGAAAEQPAKAAPSLDLCQGGKAGKVRGVGPWKWTCTKGKQKVSCIAAKAAAPVDGVCGAANGKLSKAVPSKKLCKKGKASIIEGKDSWTWTCMGSDGGKDASCSAPALTPPAEAAAPSPKAMQPQPFVPLAKKAVQSQFLNPDKAAETPEPAKEQPAQSYDKVLLPPASETPANNDTQATPPAAKEAAPAPAAAPDSSTEAASAPDVKVAADSSVPTILFASKAKVFDETGKAALDKLAASMKQTSGMRISLLAYADGTGLTPRAAKQLSLVRALAIRDYLAEKGISESRVDVHAEGANAYTGNPDRVDVRVND
ncbi:MAG: OmpA family protein, partial [Bdellovibrionales bacterium]